MKLENRLAVFFILCVLTFVFLPSNSPAASLPISGKGCWIQASSRCNELTFSDAFDWFAVASSQLDEALLEKINSRPLIAAYTVGKMGPDNLQAIKNLIDTCAGAYAGKVVAVVWDFEPDNANLPPLDEVEANLKMVHEYAQSKGLPFGLAVLTAPASLNNNHIDYKKAVNFADFLMPMLYCQWWGCDGTQTQEKYADGRAATDLPQVVLCALRASPEGDPVLIKPQQIVGTFGALTPAPDAIGFYNVQDLDASYISAIRVLP